MVMFPWSDWLDLITTTGDQSLAVAKFVCIIVYVGLRDLYRVWRVLGDPDHERPHQVR